MQHGDTISVGTVKHLALVPYGVTTGVYNDKPMLKSIIYYVEFLYGQLKDYAENLIA